MCEELLEESADCVLFGHHESSILCTIAKLLGTKWAILSNSCPFLLNSKLFFYQFNWVTKLTYIPIILVLENRFISNFILFDPNTLEKYLFLDAVYSNTAHSPQNDKIHETLLCWFMSTVERK